MHVANPDRFHRKTGITDMDYGLLARMPLFKGLARDAIQSLLSDSWVQCFARNTALFYQEEPATRFYVIFDGWVKIFRETRNGEECVIAVFSRGDCFGEAAILDGGFSLVSAEVVEESRLLVVPATTFVRQLRDDSDYALNMMATMSHHLRHLIHQVELLSVKSSTERVAEFLARLSPEASGAVTLHLPVDKALIAGRLGMQPETFSRSLAKLREIGVETRGDRVAVPDISLLRRLCDGNRTPPSKCKPLPNYG